MRLDYIDPFIESARYVLSEISRLEIKWGELSLKPAPTPTKDTITIIGLAGDVEGRVLFEMDEKTALIVAGRMNSADYSHFTPVVIDSLSELTNMMIGNAVSRLNDMGFRFTTSPPTFFKGRDMLSSTPRIETVVIPFATECGNVLLNIAVRYSSMASGATIDMLIRGLEGARKAI